MTYQDNCTLPKEFLAQIAEQGLDYLPEIIRIVVNAAMKAERQRYLSVAPYERSDARHDWANGYKPNTVRTRLGEIPFDIPQVRRGEFYPQALQKGCAVSVL
jgi:transposase-like protein